MDEILIGEKKYVSSKRAAKVTGYAKDYIGQLCREGRVPARLVGRSWYVLETAIHDHRFGDQKIEQDAQPAPITPVFPSTWESPRYESSPTEILPSINRLRDSNEQPAALEDGPKEEPPQSLQDSWRSWFDRTEDTEPVAVAIHRQDDGGDAQPSVIDEEEFEMGKTEEVNIPIHTVYELPSEVVIPRHVVGNQPDEEVRAGRGVVRVIKTTGAVLAALAIALAVIGTGYFDKYILSNSQVNIIAGVSLYSK